MLLCRAPLAPDGARAILLPFSAPGFFGHRRQLRRLHPHPCPLLDDPQLMVKNHVNPYDVCHNYAKTSNSYDSSFTIVRKKYLNS